MISSPETRAFDALRKIVNALQALAHQLDRQARITPAQHFVLVQLMDGPMASVNALAERTHTRQATVSVVVSRLVAHGLVTRRPDPHDRRRSCVALTPAGRKLLQRSAVPVQARLAAALEGMPPRQVRGLAAALEAWVTEAGLGETLPEMFLEPPTRKRRESRRA